MVNTANLKALYIAINEMMAHLGFEGDIDTRNPLVDKVMEALAEIDTGIYVNQKELKEMFDAMNKKYYDLGYSDAKEEHKQPKLFED